MTRVSHRPLLLIGTAMLACTLGCPASDKSDTEATGSGASTAQDESGSTATSGSASASATTTVTDGSATDAPTTGGTIGSDSAATDTTAATTDASTGEPPAEHFSFFVTSLVALQELSGSQEGFGGDLRFGEEGPGSGLRGADKICATIAEKSMPGAGNKEWRAFLSAVSDENGNQVNAIDRVGEGPWYDRLGRVFALTKDDLKTERPTNIDPAIKDDFPNEDGVPNHAPNPNDGQVDNHDTLTGTNELGQLYSKTATCKDWTANAGDLASEGKPRVGHSWPRYMMGPGPGPGGGDGSGANWMSSLDESGCAPGVSLIEMGPPQANSVTVGSGGGYGGFYCFALTP
jgi:hypothetical protein